MGHSYPTILLLSAPTSDWARRLNSGSFASLSASELTEVVDELSHYVKPKFTGGVDFHLNLSENVFNDPECQQEMNALLVPQKYGESPRKRKFKPCVAQALCYKIT